MEKNFPKEIASLNSVFEYIEEFMLSNRINHSATYALQFIVEELFTNLVKYNRGSRNEIALSLEKIGDSAVVQLTDFDVDEFDITKLPEVSVDEPLRSMPAGGLGVHLVRKMVDDMKYEYSNRVSKIMVTKNLRSSGVQGYGPEQ
jgi:anti-sigma regulatory factor (Ser/Thr protein kinase)